MRARFTAILGLAHLFIFAPAAKAQTVAEQLLQSSIECPAPMHDVNEGQNYGLQVLDRNHWEGNSTLFKVRDNAHELHETIRGAEPYDYVYRYTALFEDLDPSIETRDSEVEIKCKSGRECWTTVSSAYDDPYKSASLKFMTCSRSTADDMKAALRSLIMKN